MEMKAKFDPKKPHGTIVGHSWARYEQNGVLFDYNGKTQDEDDDEVQEIQTIPSDPLDRDFELEHAKEFVKTILAGGPVTKSAVYKECQNNNQKWEKVEQAFNALGGEKVRSGNWTLWKLKAD